MDFSYTEEQEMLRDLCAKIATEFGDEYWQKIDDENRFPNEFWDSLAENGILSATIPEEYGGGGTGLMELAIASEALGEFGAGNGAGGLIVNGPVFGGCLIARNGTKEQKEKYLPGLVNGDVWAGAFTEPNAGSNVSEITTRAELKDGKYVINGQKMFISNMKTAKHMAIFARTTKLDPKNKMALEGKGKTNDLLNNKLASDV